MLNKLNLTEYFYSVQGEVDVGRPAVFIRTNTCNMQPKCKFCDSKYSWNKGFLISIPELYNKIKDDLKKCKYIVFTGGEPTLQIKKIVKLIEYINKRIKNVEYGIETNGLIYVDEIIDFDYISISPKKQNYNVEVIKKYNQSIKDNLLIIRFKFVYEKDNLWFENIIKKAKLNKGSVWIMPEGQTKKEQESKMINCIEYCKEKGYNFAVRMHILVYGRKRRK